jgi:hypothetical protein
MSIGARIAQGASLNMMSHQERAVPSAPSFEEIQAEGEQTGNSDAPRVDRNNPGTGAWCWRKYSEYTLRSMNYHAPWLNHVPHIIDLTSRLTVASSVERMVNLSCELLHRVTDLNTHMVAWYTATQVADMQLICNRATAMQQADIIEVAQSRYDATRVAFGGHLLPSMSQALDLSRREPANVQFISHLTGRPPGAP